MKSGDLLAWTESRLSFIRRLGSRFWFGLFVLVPIVVSTVYFGLIASDQYASESRFVVKSPGQRQVQLSGLAGLLQSSGSSASAEQANEILEFLHSRAALNELQRRVDVGRAYRSPAADRVARYPAPFVEDRTDNLFKYYLRKVDAHTSHDTGVIELEVLAFTPQDAQKINAALLDISENFVNTLNDRAQHKAIAEAQRRVGEAQSRLAAARLAVRQYRNMEALYDPNRQAAGVQDISNRLVSEQAALQAQLDLTVKSAPANPGIPALRSRIDALSRAIAAQNGRAVGGDYSIANKVSDYEKVQQEQEFATQNLNTATASLEQARIEAQRQQFYLERISDANLPDVSDYPRRLRSTLTTAAAALCLYFIGWMLVVGILEHSPDD